jgi:hypothetical protein
MNAAPVNCGSLVRIEDLRPALFRERFLYVSTQKAASMVIDTRHDRIAPVWTSRAHGEVDADASHRDASLFVMLANSRYRDLPVTSQYRLKCFAVRNRVAQQAQCRPLHRDSSSW